MAFIGSTPIGAVVIGAVAHRFGGHAGLAAGVFGCVLAVVLGVVVDRRRDRQQIADAGRR